MGAGSPLWRTVVTTYTDAFRNLGAVMRFAWLPFAIIVLATGIHDVLSLGRYRTDSDTWSLYRDILSWSWFVIETFCLALYGFLIFDWWFRQDGAKAQPSIGNRRGRWIVFLSFIVAFFVINEILWEISDRILDYQDLNERTRPVAEDWRTAVIFVLEFIAVSRVIFVLPAAVLGEQNLSDRAWILGRGVWLRLICLLAATYGVFALVYEGVRLLSFRIQVSQWGRDNGDILAPETATFITTCLLTIVFMAGITVTAIAVCAAYRIRATEFAGRDLVLPFMPDTKA